MNYNLLVIGLMIAAAAAFFIFRGIRPKEADDPLDTTSENFVRNWNARHRHPDSDRNSVILGRFLKICRANKLRPEDALERVRSNVYRMSSFDTTAPDTSLHYILNNDAEQRAEVAGKKILEGFRDACEKHEDTLKSGIWMVDTQCPPNERSVPGAYHPADLDRAYYWLREWGYMEGKRKRREKAEAAEREQALQTTQTIAQAQDALRAFVQKYLTIRSDPNGDIPLGTVPVISLVPNAKNVIAQLAFLITSGKVTKQCFDENYHPAATETSFIFPEAPEIFKNLGIAAEPTSKDDYLKPAQSNLPPTELARLCFRNTPYLEHFMTVAPLAIPSKLRVEHCHVLARTGHGKSTALFHIVHQDIIRKEPCSIIVIEPKGDLVRNIAKLQEFAHSDRVAIIDPKYAPAFNFFALPERLKTYSPHEKKQVVANIISQYAQALSALDAETSINQKTTLAYVVELVFAMNGTLWDFLRILEDNAREYEKSTVVPPLMRHIKPGDRDFFEHQFYANMVPTSRKSLAMKIRYLMKSAPQFEEIFGAQENKIDLFSQMQTPGSVTLINTSEGTLTSDASSFFGRLMLSQIMTAALERQASQDIPHPVYVIVDEAHLYIDQTVEKFLLQTRSAKVGITLANQQLKDLKAARDTVLSQPAIKIAAPSPEDADAMARNMKVSEADLFENLNPGQFAIYMRSMPSAVKITIPNTLNTAPTMSTEEYRAFIDRNYHRFKDTPKEATPATGSPLLTDNPTVPTKDEPRPISHKTSPGGKVELPSDEI